MTDDYIVWALPAILLLTTVQYLAAARRVIDVALAVPGAVLAGYLIVLWGPVPPAGLLIVTVVAAVNLATFAIRARVTGVDVVLDTRPWRGASAASRLRGRVDRRLRRGADPSAAAVADPSPADVLTAAAVEAGSGDVTAALSRLDARLSLPQLSPEWRDANLGLLLYHRSVYAALAARTGDAPADAARWRSDLDLARTLLPDVRLGWLADAAVAVAEGRRWTAVHTTDALLGHARGPWERSLGAVLARLARDVPDEYRERRSARLLARNPWATGLSRRLAADPART